VKAPSMSGKLAQGFFSRRSRLSGPAWVLVYVGVYVGLLGAASVLDVFLYSSRPSFGGALIEFLAALLYLVPFSVVPMTVVLWVLWCLRHFRFWVFRSAALLLCCLPSALTNEPDMLKFYLPAQVVLALVVRQPYSTANEDPAGPESA
jgi:hypothetical protein